MTELFGGDTFVALRKKGSDRLKTKHEIGSTKRRDERGELTGGDQLECTAQLLLLNSTESYGVSLMPINSSSNLKQIYKI